MMRLKKTCCEKYRKKAKACKRCPLVAAMSKKERKRLLAKAKADRKRRKKEKKKRAA